MNDDKNIFAIIGAGAIGSRHLQGLCKLNSQSTIYVIDPSKESLTQAEQRASEVQFQKDLINLNFSTDMSPLPKRLSVAILATSSQARLQAMCSLLKKSKPDALVLEKIAFPCRESFAQADKEIHRNGIRTWVNCPRRMNPAYEFIRENIKCSGPLTMNVKGANYGLACNAIHFIDLFAFISENSSYSIGTERLLPEIFQSKRRGYSEIFGELNLKFENSGNLSISCEKTEDNKPQFVVDLSGEGFKIQIDEINNRISVERDDRTLFSDLSYTTLFQSELTKVLAEELIDMKTCRLATFEESMALHLPFLDAVSEFYTKLTGNPASSLLIT
ncbi:MAG TPA: hypothetical protein PK821_02140 [Victivallales bacterium]|nr:hypothetical protein [Victivallales bacterium]